MLILERWVEERRMYDKYDGSDYLFLTRHGQSTGRVDADPLNDHIVEKMDCPQCGGRGWRLKDRYEVKAV